MKKILIVAASAGLMSLAACGESVTNTEVANTSLEANASAYDEGTDNTVNAVAENVVENAAEMAPANAN